MKINKIYLDLDGCVCNFKKAYELVEHGALHLLGFHHE